MARLTVTYRAGAVHDVEAPADETLMIVLRDLADLPVEGLCGGCASCGTCHVFVAETWVDRLPPRQGLERSMLESLYHFDERRSRLACQLTVRPQIDGLAVSLAPQE
jgi:ferredoxin